MDFSPSPRAAELLDLVGSFVRDEVEPVAAAYHREASQSAADTRAPSSGRVPIRYRRRGWPGGLTIPALCPPEVSTKVVSVSVYWWILYTEVQGAT